MRQKVKLESDTGRMPKRAFFRNCVGSLWQNRTGLLRGLVGPTGQGGEQEFSLVREDPGLL